MFLDPPYIAARKLYGRNGDLHDRFDHEKPLRGGPVNRGFDSFFGIRASTDIPPYFYIRGDRAATPPTGHIDAGASPIQGAFWRAGGIAPDLKLSDVLPRLTYEAISVIEKRRGAREPLMCTSPTPRRTHPGCRRPRSWAGAAPACTAIS